MIFGEDYSIRPLDPSDPTAGFKAGDPAAQPLKSFLQNQAQEFHQHSIAKTYVADASALLVVFSIGIGTGSLLCEVLSKRHVEIGLVPLGAIGMSVFAVDLHFASRGLPASELMGLGAFLAISAHWRVMADLALLSLFAGLYSVPMYALIQLRSLPTHRLSPR